MPAKGFAAHIRGRLLSSERLEARGAHLVFISELELDRPNWAAVENPRIGSIELRNRNLRALIGMPASVLGPVLQMLASSRIRYVDLDASSMVRGAGDLESYLMVKQLSELEPAS